MSLSSLARFVWLPTLLRGACGPTALQTQDVLTLEVGPHTVECTGESTQRCLLVREGPADEWRRFYGSIEGFAHEEGFHYRIEVERRRIPNPPADASSFAYRLVRVLSRVRASPG